MKNFYLTIIVALSSVSVSSQTLSNTTWIVYDSTNSFVTFFKFGSDTLSHSMYNMDYEDLSTFQENGNSFTLIDLPNNSWCPEDTGKYTFLIENDTLKLTLISDLCVGRPEVLSGSHWIKLLTGTKSINLSSVIKIYPNPANDVITIQLEPNIQNSSYIIFDHLGRQALNGNLTGETTMVDIKHLTMGLYYIQIGEKRKQLLKVMKK